MTLPPELTNRLAGMPVVQRDVLELAITVSETNTRLSVTLP